MQGNSRKMLVQKVLAFVFSGFILTTVWAGIPVWTFEPLTPTTIAVPANGTATVQYRVTNQSNKSHTLIMQPIRGVTQITTGLNVCGNPFVLQGKNSCTLSLQINGSQLSSRIVDGPVVCQHGSTNQCYRPSSANILHITQVSPVAEAEITVTNSPLTLTVDGATGALIINNISTQVTATNITSNFTGTALEGNVTETGNTCVSVLPGESCTLTYTPGNTVVPQTNFTIQGTNTNVQTAAIAIQTNITVTAINPDTGTTSGGTGVTLTGTGLTNASAITFGGVPATSVNVVNSTTVTAVTPAHIAEVVDVVVSTPDGDATLTNGYTYENTTVGQASGGGIIACVDGGTRNLIAATVDNSTGIVWGPVGVAVGAQTANGANNTAAIVACLTGPGSVSPNCPQNIDVNTYAAGICSNYQVDSQGNTPCEDGNTCYDDWFLPAGAGSPAAQLNCLYVNREAIGGFSDGIYWGSSEGAIAPLAYSQNFATNRTLPNNKSVLSSVRCVRAFTPFPAG